MAAPEISTYQRIEEIRARLEDATPCSDLARAYADAGSLLEELGAWRRAIDDINARQGSSIHTPDDLLAYVETQDELANLACRDDIASAIRTRGETTNE